MKISFLVTYYNQEKYVYDSLNSISQIKIPSDYEILVGNDGSADNTLLEVEKWRNTFGDRLIVYTASRDDGITDGVIRAGNLRRELYKKSTGDCFCVLDGDDFYCDTDFISEAIDVFIEHADVSVVMFKHRMYYDDCFSEINPRMPQGILEASLYIRTSYCGSGACVLRSFRNNDYISRLSSAIYYDDNDIPILNLAFGKLFFIDRSVINYRQHDDSTWNSMSRAEQGVLNVLGADNETALAPNYKEDIYYRYRRDIFYTYFRRRNIIHFIDENALQKYKMIANRLFALSKVLVDFESSAENEREEVNSIVSALKERDNDEYERIRSNILKEGYGI